MEIRNGRQFGFFGAHGLHSPNDVDAPLDHGLGYGDGQVLLGHVQHMYQEDAHGGGGGTAQLSGGRIQKGQHLGGPAHRRESCAYAKVSLLRVEFFAGQEGFFTVMDVVGHDNWK